ncbi:MAG TPA: alpha/beta fold hydrolase [Clostridia bacterium]|nr:alpha/beta fold hydrolase [Clostridia bacterium]
MRFDYLYKDPVVGEKEFPPDMASVSIDGNTGRMFGVMYTAKGCRPHPTMIILHGFPGTEKNLDLAHAFRRAGWNSLVFHYRGAWGSEGCFSFQNVLDDVKAALKFLRSDEVIDKYRVDKHNIALVGHSMGGFAALMTAADDPDIKACVAMAPFNLGSMGEKAGEEYKTLTSLQEMFKECILPLNGATVDGLLNEVMTNSKKWNPANAADRILKHNLLLIAGSRDTIALPEFHYYPLLDKLLSYSPPNFEYHLLDSDHSFQDKRILLTELIEGWLERQLGK